VLTRSRTGKQTLFGDFGVPRGGLFELGIPVMPVMINFRISEDAAL